MKKNLFKNNLRTMCCQWERNERKKKKEKLAKQIKGNRVTIAKKECCYQFICDYYRRNCRL